MRRLLQVMAVFAFAAGVNTASVAVQQQYGWLTRRFGSRGWEVHLALIAPPWLWFLWLLSRLDRQVRWSLPHRLRFLGLPLQLAAATIWVLAFVRMGPIRTWSQTGSIDGC